ncbi:hypothetical protein BT63DRAFT_207541 [Microthyrium microscopicum]|uniref:CorA-like transporter domain-containing protein n=1 Tax=Microthyrium microscopicum TaxID=703497 RepID=A0A6A6UFL1_9PEZI|nr:hypothetical protein BT63DRAFT_207541 [Microthyrium microscopicum]
MALSDDWNSVTFSADVCDATTLDVGGLLNTIEARRRSIFTKLDKLNVRVTDVTSDGLVASSICRNSQQLHTKAGPDSQRGRVRIISIYARSTIEPLQITSSSMQSLLKEYDVHPEFLKTVLAFGIEPNVADCASSTLNVKWPSETRSCISYLLNYVEENHRNPSKPWSFRRTAVYHDQQADFDFFLLLHPNNTDTFSRRVERLFMPSIPREVNLDAQKLALDPSRLHLLVLSSYVENWRPYITFLADSWEDENDLALGVEPQKAQPQDSFYRVQELRNINDLACFVLASTSGTLDLITRLKDSSESILKNNTELESYSTSVSGSIASCNAFIPRIRNTIDLVGYTLTLHNQLETAKVDEALKLVTEELRDLTKNTVDDSATVKIVTLLSTLYLPGSFIASVYGMNFFVFDTTTRRIVIGHDFWVFILTWLPLTLITGLGFYLMRYPGLFNKPKKRQAHVKAINSEKV